ncbi:MAG: hypothetical protein HY901_03120 [Deltaproteobacteria bacterium]|nr:hypothetical protein [Deltaproteobacteria bacterium]
MVSAAAEQGPVARLEKGAAPARPAAPKPASPVVYPNLDKAVDPEQAVFEIKVQRRAPKPSPRQK